MYVCVRSIWIYAEVHRGSHLNTRSLGKMAVLKYISVESPCPKDHFVSGSDVHYLGKRYCLSALQILNTKPRVVDPVLNQCYFIDMRWFVLICICWEPLSSPVWKSPNYPSLGNCAFIATGRTTDLEFMFCSCYFQSAYFKGVHSVIAITYSAESLVILITSSQCSVW